MEGDTPGFYRVYHPSLLYSLVLSGADCHLRPRTIRTVAPAKLRCVLRGIGCQLNFAATQEYIKYALKNTILYVATRTLIRADSMTFYCSLSCSRISAMLQKKLKRSRSVHSLRKKRSQSLPSLLSQKAAQPSKSRMSRTLTQERGKMLARVPSALSVAH